MTPRRHRRVIMTSLAPMSWFSRSPVWKKTTASIPENLHLFAKTIFQDPLPILEDRLLGILCFYDAHPQIAVIYQQPQARSNKRRFQRLITTQRITQMAQNKTPKVPADWSTVLYLLTKAQVCLITGYSPKTIEQLSSAGHFPRPIRLAANRAPRWPSLAVAKAMGL